MNPIWTTVHAERSALIADLDTLAPGQWDTPSLCPGWTVHDVLAHLVDDATTTKPGFVLALIRARGDFNRANAQGIVRHKHTDPRRTLDAFRTAAHRTTSAPAPLATRLVEAIVHAEDIRRPLGIDHDYPTAAVIDALDYQLKTSTKMGGSKERALGLKLILSDADVTRGDGDPVRGTAIALLLAACGRPVRPGELTGPGAARLTASHP